MGLMGSLYVGTSGLRVSQDALNTTAHNMSNVDTKGYTRQQVALGSSEYNILSKTQCATSWMQLGLGVTYTQTRQVRDYFLDKNFRRESGRSMFYETSANTLRHVEDILGESNEGKSFQLSITDLWTAVQELAKDPANQVNQNLFVTRCDEFINRAAAVYQGLKDYQLNMNRDVRNAVNDINRSAARIEELNNAIIKIEAGRIEHANDLRDERNALIDNLSKYGNLSWQEDMNGYVNIKFEGTDLIKDGIINKIDMYEDPQTQFVTPYWHQFAKYKLNEDGEEVVIPETVKDAQIFDLSRPISSEINTDVGGLRAILLARGDHPATYRDMNNTLGHYDEEISQSIMMNVEAEFDQLINKVVTKINGILEEAANAAKDKWGDTGYLMQDGEPIQVFQLKIEEEGFTAGNIVINMELRQTPSLLKFRLPDGEEDKETMRKLTEAFTEEDYVLNPNVATKVNFQKYYNSLVNQVANSGSVYRTIQSSQEDTVNSLDSAREQVLGVSTDEELSNMIMFQNAFNASSRYINVVSEMLEHIINTLGMM